MAKFNPDLPLTQDPNYLNYSHAAPKPDADLSLGTLFSGIGDIISTGAKAVKGLSERGIEQQIRERVEPVRDDFIDQLQGAVTKMAQANPAQAAQNAAGPLPPQITGPVSTSDGTGTEAGTDILNYDQEGKGGPPIEGALSQIKQLQSARQVKPELRTYYDGRMLAIAREMRAQYPGQVDFIDQKISEITGGNPANKMVGDLLSSIQSYIGSRKGEEGKIESAIISAAKSGDLSPDIAPQVWNHWHQTKDTASILRMLSQSQATKKAHEARVMRSSETEMDTNEKAATAVQNMTLLSSEHAANVMDVATSNFNVAGRNIRSGKDMFQFLSDVQSGKIQVDGKDTVALAQGIQGMRNQAAAKLWADANRIGPDGLSEAAKISAKYGPERTKQIIENGLSWFDEIRNNITKGDWSLAATNSEWAKAAINDKTRQFLDRKDGLQEPFLLQAVIEKLSPGASRDFFMKMLEQPGITGNVRKLLELEAYRMGAQQDSTNPDTIKSAIERGRKFFPDASVNNIAKYNQGVINTLSLLTDKTVKDPVKLNQITAAFDPTMKGFLATVPGNDKNLVFRKFTSPEVLKEIQRLDQAHPDQNVMGRYKTWMEESFAFNLLPKSVANVNEALRQPGVQITWTPPTANSSGRFDARPKDVDTSSAGSRYGQVKNNYVAHTQTILNGLNYNLQSVMEYAKSTGQDPEGYILDLMAKSGLDIKAELHNPRGSLVKSIVSSRLEGGRGSKMDANSKVGE